MLELRPNCECCDKDLPLDSSEAVICTFECTFCQFCASGVLGNPCQGAASLRVSCCLWLENAWKVLK